MNTTGNKGTKMATGSRGSTIVQAPIVGAIGISNTWERRKQTICMFSCSLYFIFPMVFLCWGLTIYSLFHVAKVPVLCYLAYMFLLDRAPTNGSRRPWLRNFRRWWSYSTDYLPLLLVKTADLDPNGKYVLGYHPHGIISVGCFGAFATDSARTLSLADKRSSTTERGFSSLFPGIDVRVITLPQNFTTPFLREYFLAMGACTSAKTTFRRVLRKDGGTALVVVVGGAAESMMTHEGDVGNLVLEKRRGFVREAIMGNASLVPVIGFGENDLYQTYKPEEKHWISRVQKIVKNTSGMAMPLYLGRGIFLRDVGGMPQRKPVVVVVGAPIAPPELDAEHRASFHPEIDRKTDKALNEDGELVKEWHAKYIKALEALYATYKDEHWNLPGKQRSKSMKIVR